MRGLNDEVHRRWRNGFELCRCPDRGRKPLGGSKGATTNTRRQLFLEKRVPELMRRSRTLVGAVRPPRGLEAGSRVHASTELSQDRGLD